MAKVKRTRYARKKHRNTEHDRNLSFTRRAVLIGALQGSCLALLGTRLAWLQIAEGAKYRTLADQNRVNVKLLAPSRGLIVDRSGIPMAVNTQNFRVMVIPEQTDDLEDVLVSLQKLIPLSDDAILLVMKQAKKAPSFAPLIVRENLTWDEVSTVEVNLPELPGLSIDVGEIRFYPIGGATAHILGYVGAANKGELNSTDPLMKLPGFKIGKTGVEKTYDEALRGSAGAAEIEVNVVGREVREMSRNPGQPGQVLTMTIDSELQKFLEDRLIQAKSASAVVMDVHTGSIYALASAPTFDPNIFARSLTPQVWEELMTQEGHPLNNKAVGGLYPPGSTFKMVTALAALEHGIINKNTTFFCPGHFNFGDTLFHCWKPGGHGHVNVVSALAQSCDVFFYNTAIDIGIERLAAMSRKLSFGAVTGVELPEEKAGLFPDPTWKRGKLNAPWLQGETINAVIGQGYTQATAMQLAVMTSRLVNGGKAVKPHLAEYIGGKQTFPEEWPKLGFKPQHLQIIIEGMVAAVNEPHGTALGSKIKIEGMEMGGKTGTAQVKRITMAERAAGVKNENLPWHLRHHALFVGFAPVGNPRYACSVIVEHGVGGGLAAAPIGRDLLLMTQQRDPAAKEIATPNMPIKPIPAQTPQVPKERE
ncbi:MAG: mrdA [Micavibrio sp.]|nr:mrdA [Micavibrio sp.]